MLTIWRRRWRWNVVKDDDDDYELVDDLVDEDDDDDYDYDDDPVDVDVDYVIDDDMMMTMMMMTTTTMMISGKRWTLIQFLSFSV